MPVVSASEMPSKPAAQEALDEAQHHVLGHVALERAAEGGRQAHRDLHAGLVRHLHHGRQLGERLLVRAVDVGAVVGLGSRHHAVHLVGLRAPWPPRSARRAGSAPAPRRSRPARARCPPAPRSASARAGTGLGETNEVTSILCSPVRDSWSISSTFVARRDEVLLDLEAVAHGDVVDVETHPGILLFSLHGYAGSRQGFRPGRRHPPPRAAAGRHHPRPGRRVHVRPDREHPQARGGEPAPRGRHLAQVPGAHPRRPHRRPGGGRGARLQLLLAAGQHRRGPPPPAPRPREPAPRHGPARLDAARPVRGRPGARHPAAGRRRRCRAFA